MEGSTISMFLHEDKCIYLRQIITQVIKCRKNGTWGSPYKMNFSQVILNCTSVLEGILSSGSKAQRYTFPLYMIKKYLARARSALPYHILWNLVSLQVFNILVCSVDNFSQFLSLNHLLKHPHVDFINKLIIGLCVGADYPCDGRTPVKNKKRVTVSI